MVLKEYYQNDKTMCFYHRYSVEGVNAERYNRSLQSQNCHEYCFKERIGFVSIIMNQKDAGLLRGFRYNGLDSVCSRGL